MADSSNTGKSRKPGTFLPGKGRDPRINRKGRPRNFDALRELAKEIGNEPLSTPDGKPYTIDGHIVTRVEAIMRSWALSKDPRLQRAFVDVAYGHAPTEITGADGGPIQVQDASFSRSEIIAILTAADIESG